METLKIQDLSPEQLDKIKFDLRFIESITQLGKVNGYRIIIAGGYAVDGALGQITRLHSDIDIQIYVQGSITELMVNDLLHDITDKEAGFTPYSIIDKDHGEFYHNFYITLPTTIADIYVLETLNDPFDSLKIIVKKDRTHTLPHPYETITVSLMEVSFEAQHPLVEVADKIYKREHRGDVKKEKHDQDIENLKLLVDEESIIKKVHTLSGI